MLHNKVRNIATVFYCILLVRGVSGEESVARLDEQGEAREDTGQVSSRTGVPGKLYSSGVSLKFRMEALSVSGSLDWLLM